MKYLTPEQWGARLTRAQRKHVDELIAQSGCHKRGIYIDDRIVQRKKKAIPKHTHNVKEYDTFTEYGQAIHVEYRY